MKLRAVILLVLLAAGVGLSFRPEARLKMKEINLLFLDFLNANTRSRLDKEPLPASDDVVFVEFREADKKEYSAWPPAPLDYIMVLKRLAGHDPEVVVFSEVLKWDKPDVQFMGELQQAFLNFPAVVLAFSAQEIGGEAADSAIHEEVGLPSIAAVVGNAKLAPRLGKYEFPTKTLRTQMQLGFVPQGKADAATVLLVARSGDALTPSLAAQILALQEHAPYASQRLRFGRGAGLYLGELFVPLEENGTVAPKLAGDITRINALDLMTPSLPDTASHAAEAKIGKHKVIVVGTAPSSGEAQMRAVAWALALPKLHRAPAMVEWIAAAAAALLGLWQLRFGRLGAIFFGVGAMAVMLAVALAEFQTARWWFAPALPGGITVLATVFCFLWPHGKKAAHAPTAAAEPPAAGTPA